MEEQEPAKGNVVMMLIIDGLKDHFVMVAWCKCGSKSISSSMPEPTRPSYCGTSQSRDVVMHSPSLLVLDPSYRKAKR
jgi:hypothetical protein